MSLENGSFITEDETYSRQIKIELLTSRVAVYSDWLEDKRSSDGKSQ